MQEDERKVWLQQLRSEEGIHLPLKMKMEELVLKKVCIFTFVCNGNDGAEFKGAILSLNDEIVSNRCKLQSLLAVSLTVPVHVYKNTENLNKLNFWYKRVQVDENQF